MPAWRTHYVQLVAQERLAAHQSTRGATDLSIGPTASLDSNRSDVLRPPFRSVPNRRGSEQAHSLARKMHLQNTKTPGAPWLGALGPRQRALADGGQPITRENQSSEPTTRQRITLGEFIRIGKMWNAEVRTALMQTPAPSSRRDAPDDDK